jgi:hypothetical protein
MKIVDSLQLIHEDESWIDIDPPTADALRMREEVTLYMVALTPEKASPKPGKPDEGAQSTPGGEGATAPQKSDECSQYTPEREMTLIASPFPEASWGHLLRMSVTLNPFSGSLHRLVRTLNDLHLHCRHLEVVNGVDLIGASAYRLDRRLESIFSPKEDAAPTEETAPKEEAVDLLLPSAFFVIELRHDRDRKDQGQEGEFLLLHKELGKLLKEGYEPGREPVERSKLEKLVESILRDKAQDTSIKIDWISPMSTLNKLSYRLKGLGESSIIKKFSQKITLKEAPKNGLRLDLATWRSILWKANQKVPYRAVSRPRNPLFVKGYMDSDERVLCWDFFQFKNDLVVQFDVTTPTAGLEQLWWEWVYDCVGRAKGNILATSSSARIDAYWGTLRVTVVFPLQAESHGHGSGDIKRIVNCFRELQGDCGYSEKFEEFRKHLAERSLIVYASIGTQKTGAVPKELSFSSRLENVKIWDPSVDAVSRGFSEHFAPNPFSFTNPLDLDSYKRLYGEGGFGEEEPGSREVLQRSRRRLAERIIERLSGDPGENIAIVGAHRAGKTTVLNLVYDDIVSRLISGGGEVKVGAEGGQHADKSILIPLRVNAAMVPPHMFFDSIVKQLKPLAAVEDEAVPGVPKKAAAALFGALGAFTKVAEFSLGAFALSGDRAIKEFHELIEIGKEKSLGSIRDKVVKDDFVPEFLRRSLEALLEGIKEAEGSLREEEGRPGIEKRGISIRLVVIVDEFSESSKWGDKRALPVWRQMIESREYSQIKWLISTSRRVEEAAEYSPITNVLCEHNVGALRPEESERMIDAFGVLAWKRQLSSNGRQAATEREYLRPVITHQARLFLVEVTSGLPYFLQVACYHIYDRSTRTHVPIVNRDTCIDVIIERVLMELSDYLEHQWHHTPQDAQRFVKEELKKKSAAGSSNEELKHFFRNLDLLRGSAKEMSPGVRKALARSGLYDGDSHCVAPLVAAWLLRVGAD